MDIHAKNSDKKQLLDRDCLSKHRYLFELYLISFWSRLSDVATFLCDEQLARDMESALSLSFGTCSCLIMHFYTVHINKLNSFPHQSPDQALFEFWRRPGHQYLQFQI